MRKSRYYTGICRQMLFLIFAAFANHYAIFRLSKRNARNRRGRDRMVVGFITTYAISVYRQ
jgi:hypothetical protein